MNEIAWTSQLSYPILALLQLLPLFAVFAVWLMRKTNLLIGVGIALAVIELALAVVLYVHFDHNQPSFQFAERITLLGPLSYHVAVDGVSVLFILLTSLLTLLITLYAPVRGLRPHNRFLMLVFATQATIIGMLATVDLLWFIVLSAVNFGLLAYMLWRWGTSEAKGLAVTRYLQFMATGLLLLVMGALMLGWHYADITGEHWTFNLFALQQVPVTSQIQVWIFFLLFYGLAIRIPLFPLHGWLPLAAEHGNVAVAPVFLLGVKTGVYGLLRFVFPLLPEAVNQWHQYVAAFAVAGIFYAALLAMLEHNMRRLLAFAVVSHTSILVIGLFSLTHQALQGSVLLAVNFGLASAGLLFMTGLIFRRTHTTRLPELGGLFDRIPLIGIAFFVAGLSIVGMPGTPGFDAAHLVLEAAIGRFGALVTIAAAIGNVLAAGFLLWAFQRAFLTPRTEELGPLDVERTTSLEMIVAGILILILLGTGFYGEPWLLLIDKSLSGLTANYALAAPTH